MSTVPAHTRRIMLFPFLYDYGRDKKILEKLLNPVGKCFENKKFDSITLGVLKTSI